MCLFQSGTHNKHARVLTIHRVPSLKKKNGGNFVNSVDRKVTNFVCFPNIPGKQQHCCIVLSGETIFIGQN